MLVVDHDGVAFCFQCLNAAEVALAPRCPVRHEAERGTPVGDSLS
jgi:hypothetical protein